MVRSNNFPKRDDELRVNHAEGLTWNQISKRMNIAEPTLRKRAYGLGLNNREIGKHCGRVSISFPARDDELRSLAVESLNLTWKQISERMGISFHCVKKRGQIIGISKKYVSKSDLLSSDPIITRRGRPVSINSMSRAWPMRDDELRAHHTEGLPWADIAQKMKLNATSVKKRGHFLKLSNKQFSGQPNPGKAKFSKKAQRSVIITGLQQRATVVHAGAITLPPLPCLLLPLPVIMSR